MASSYPTTAVGTAGETGSNLGTGTGAYDSKLVNVLQFRSLVAGAGISFSEAGGEITVAAPGTDVTLSSAGGTTLVNDGAGPSLALKGLTAGTGVSLSSTASAVTITFTGEANTASNLGSGAQVFGAKVGADLRFRSIVGQGSVTVTQDAPSAGNIQISLGALQGATAPWIFTRTLASGTVGGSVVASTWTVAPFNTTSGNSLTNVQRAVAPAGTNQFRIVDGTYWVYAQLPMVDASGFTARLFNVTDSSVVIWGLTMRNQVSLDLTATATSYSIVLGAFTVSGGPKVFQFEVFMLNSTPQTINMGYPMGISGVNEVYNMALFYSQ